MTAFGFAMLVLAASAGTGALLYTFLVWRFDDRLEDMTATQRFYLKVSAALLSLCVCIFVSAVTFAEVLK